MIILATDVLIVAVGLIIFEALLDPVTVSVVDIRCAYY